MHDKVEADELTTALLRASRVLVAVAARSLAEVEGVVTLAQFRALVVLANQPSCTQRALAEALDVNASTALRMVDRLVAAGMVTRGQDEGDRRQVRLALSDEGRQVVERVTERRRREIAGIAGQMPPERTRDFLAALQSFGDAADEPVPGLPALLWE